MDPKKLKIFFFIFKEKQSELETVNQQLTGEQRQRHEDGEVIVKLKQVIVREMTQRGPPFCSICQSGFAPNQQSLCILQEIKDTLDGQRILEKKGSAAVSSPTDEGKRRRHF